MLKGIFAPMCVGVNYLLHNMIWKDSNEKGFSAMRWAVFCLPLNHKMKYHLANGFGTARNLSNHFHRCMSGGA